MERKEYEEYADVVIPVTQKNICTLRCMIPYMKKNISCGHIYVIASKNIEKDIRKINGVEFVDEDHVFDGMAYATIAGIIKRLTGKQEKIGWYFQQFLKLAWAYKCDKAYYIVIDADTIPLNKINFLDENRNYLFTQKIEFNEPYFITIDKLFNGELRRMGNFSFVAEHMVFDCCIVKEMLNLICQLHPERGKTFYEIILNSIDVNDLGHSGFSEFETYGTYILTKYPELVKLRKLRTLREATYVIGGNPTNGQLKWAKQDFDIISIEGADYANTLLTWVTNIFIFRKLFKLKTIAKVRKKIRTVYRKIVGKIDFEFD